MESSTSPSKEFLQGTTRGTVKHRAVQEETHEASNRNIHGWRWAIAYTSMLSTTFLFSLDNTIVADIQPAILAAFGDVQLLPWIGTAFALGTMFILTWGKVYGVFNIRKVYIFNILLFEIGSAICGASPNMTALILGRIIAGVGGSGMYSGTLTYVSISTTDKERAAYLAGSTVVWGIGSVLGPVVGGAFADSSATWRWGFYINLVVGAVFAPAYLLLFPNVDPQPGTTFRQKCRMMDWIMIAVFLAGSACLTIAVSFGGTAYPFDSAAVIAMWTVASLLLIASIFVAKYHPGVDKEHRLYPAHFLKRPILINLQLQVFLVSGIILAMTYYIPLYFQFVRGDGALEAGVRLLPLIIFMVVVSMINGILLPKTPYYSPWYIGGSALTLIGTVLMCTITENTPDSNVYGYTILIGAGAGCYVVAGFGIVQSLVPVTDIANAVGAMTISQDLGMVLFLSMSGSVYQNIAVQKIREVLPSFETDEIAQLIAGVSSAAFKSLSADEKALVIPEIIDALQNVWLLFTVAAALSFVLSVPMLKQRLGGKKKAAVDEDASSGSSQQPVGIESKA